MDRFPELKGLVVYNASDVYDFEKNFNSDIFFSWMVKNWTLSFWYSAVYVFLIFAGRKYMATRQKFDLRMPLIIWSGLLGVFSIAGAVRTIPETVYMISQHGFRESVCNPSYVYAPSTSLWGCLFVVSKVYELGDTVFIVLRKQPLIFLHWYHHITVLIYVWFSYVEHTAPGRWFVFMNYTVHAFMYSYYCLKAMRFRIPKWISMMITSLQLLQMIVGIIINYMVYYYYQHDGKICKQSSENLQYSTLMYTSYFILFAHFFYNAYIAPKVPKGTKHHQNGILTEETLSSIAKKIH